MADITITIATIISRSILLIIAKTMTIHITITRTMSTPSLLRNKGNDQPLSSVLTENRGRYKVEEVAHLAVQQKEKAWTIS